MLLAVATSCEQTDSRGRWDIPGSFLLTSAMAWMCFRDTVPAVSCPGRRAPLSRPAAFFRKYEAGGERVFYFWHGKTSAWN